MTGPLDVFQAALSFHGQGRLREAARLYRAVLKRDRGHFGALHHLGVLLAQQGRLDDSLKLIRRALKQQPGSAEAHCDLGVALESAKRHEEAIGEYETALALKPDYAEAHFNLGNALRGVGRVEAAIPHYQKALALKPGDGAAHNNLGTALHQVGRDEDAIASYERALALNSGYAEARNNLGVALATLKRHEEAIAQFERALALKPDYAEAHNNLGDALHALKRPAAAIPCYRRALARKPDYVEAHNNLGTALEALDRDQEAAACFERALALEPGHAEAHYNLGNSLVHLRRPGEAIPCYERALALKPDYVEAHNNLGIALVALNRHREAITQYERARALKPNDDGTQWNESLARLAVGDFQVGWKQYECRWSAGVPGLRKRDFPQPLWLGDGDLSGKTILLRAEQGLGDMIQFARYVPLVARRGARVVLEVQSSLASLFAGLPGAPTMVVQGDPLPPFDCHCPLASLPLAFGTRSATIPAEVPYLFPPPDKIAHWRSEIGQDGRPLIGLTWWGRQTSKELRDRSIPLRRLLPLLELPGLRWVALQKELADGDAEALAPFDNVSVVGDRLEDFSDTASLVSMVDLVITIDTSVAHLAGALGKPVWILLRYSPDWRWLQDREDSPWYPSARLFRQPAIGDWKSVVARVRRALEGFRS